MNYYAYQVLIIVTVLELFLETCILIYSLPTQLRFVHVASFLSRGEIVPHDLSHRAAAELI